MLGNDDSQRPGPHTVAKRRPHHCDLAVCRNANAAAPRLNRNFGGAHRDEFLSSLDASQKRTQRKPYESEPPRAVRKVQAQLAGVEASSPADIEALHFIFIVADEYKRCAAREFPAVGVQSYVKKRISSHHAERGPDKCRPLAVSESLPLFALVYEARIKTQARVVEEDLSVDLPDINLDRVVCDDRLRSSFQVERNRQILGEVVERAERQNSQRFVGVDQRRCDRVDRAVAAPGNNGRGVTSNCASREVQQALSIPGERDARLDSVLLKELGEPLTHCFLAGGARAGIDDDLHGSGRVVSLSLLVDHLS